MQRAQSGDFLQMLFSGKRFQVVIAEEFHIRSEILHKEAPHQIV